MAMTNFDQIVDLFKALSNDARLRIVCLLREGELSVNEITQIMQQSQPRVSQHLKALCEAGILERFREQHHMYYRVPLHGVGNELIEALKPFLPTSDPQILEDEKSLSKIKSFRQKLSVDYLEEEAPEWTHLHELHGDEEAFANAVIKVIEDEPVGELLDVATGTGRMLKILGPLCSRGVGIDLSQKMANVARSAIQQAELSHCTIRQDDMYQMRFANESFDTVSIDQVLYFAERPEDVIAEAARVLVPGGRMLIVAFSSTVKTQLKQLGYTPTSIKAWCSGAGLTSQRQHKLKGQKADIILLVAYKDE